MVSLNHYIDRHRNEMCFVLGSGPSLRNLNVELLRSHLVIAVNASILKVPFARYYFSCDTAMTLQKSWWTLKDLECDLILATNSGFSAFQSRIGKEVFEGINKSRIQYIGRKSNNLIDRGNTLIKGSSSVHPAVHFAYVLGCSPIVLVGCDCKYVEGKKHFWDFPNQPEEGLIDSKFDELRRPLSPTKPGAATDGELQHHLGVWKQIAEGNPNLPIIDASGGRLNYFEQRPLEEILR